MKPKFLLRERLPSLRTLYAVQKVPYARVFFVAVTGVRRFRTLGTLILGARFKLGMSCPSVMPLSPEGGTAVSRPTEL